MAQAEWSNAAKVARAQAAVDMADAAATASRIRIYDAKGAGRTLLADVVLQQPCATVSGAGVITILPDWDNAEVVVTTGLAAWAEWCDGDGTVVRGFDVGEPASGASLEIEGAAGTAMLVAGGLVQLGTLTMG